MVSAVLVAAGLGTRMGPNVDKLFLNLIDRPVVTYAWQTFDQSSDVDEIILVVREGMQMAFSGLAEKFRFQKAHRIVAGGAERQDSVWNGLQAISPASEIVAIQDTARPCTTAALIADTISAAREYGAAVAAQAVTDTVKESSDGAFIQRTVDRSRLWSVQTPQTFRVDIICRALEEVRRQGARVTDDTAACELIGQRVRLVPSKDPNPKVTRPEDLPFIEHLLRNRQSTP